MITLKKILEAKYQELTLILQWNFSMQPLLTSLGKTLPKEIQTGTSHH